MFTIEAQGESVILTTDQAGPVTMTVEQASALVDQIEKALSKAQEAVAHKRAAAHQDKEVKRVRPFYQDAVDVVGADGLTYLATWGRDPSGYIVIKWPAGRAKGVNPTLPARWLVPYGGRIAHLFTGYKAPCGEEAKDWTEPKPTAKRCLKCAQGAP